MEREKQPKQQDHIQPQSSLPSQSPREIALTESPKITPTNDRLKRDEWSEGAVSCLLEAYEAKWTLRNRAKLKGQDWEDVARHVSARSNGSKTQTQCKNKIESMKKRYRSESAAADASSWPLYPRLDLLLRGNGPNTVGASIPPAPVVVVELPSVVAVPPVLPPPVTEAVAVAAAPAVLEVGSVAQKSHVTNDGGRLGKVSINYACLRVAGIRV